jgi:uridine kinase
LSQHIDAEIVPVDAYYHPLDHLDVARRGLVNFDEPASIDHPFLAEQLQTLAAGTPVSRPIYDFALHTRGAQTVPVRPAPFLLVEGLFPLYWPSVRGLLNAGIYIGAKSELCLDRRVRRDTVERGRSALSVEQQYASTVAPMREQFVEPTARFADLVLDGSRPIEENGTLALRFLNDRFPAA